MNESYAEKLAALDRAYAVEAARLNAFEAACKAAREHWEHLEALRRESTQRLYCAHDDRERFLGSGGAS